MHGVGPEEHYGADPSDPCGRRTDLSRYPHEGEEFGYVIKGEITIHIGKKTHAAKAGESFYYTPEKKHHISSKKGAKLIWVSSPPSF